MEQEQEQSNPALDSARAEHDKALNDPSHPQYQLWQRNPNEWQTWLDGVYRKAGVQGQPDLGEVVVKDASKEADEGQMSPEQAAAAESDDMALKVIEEEHGPALPMKQASFQSFAGAIESDVLLQIEALLPADPAVLPVIFRLGAFLNDHGYAITKKGN